MTRPHLTRDELQRWWERGDPADRDRVVSHLADCDECGALYAELIDRQPAPAGTPDGVPAALLSRAYRAYRPRQRLAWWASPGLVAAGALAAVLLAVAVPSFRRVESPSRGVEAIRGSTLQPIAPIGETRPPVRFRWASPVDAVRYAVEIRDADGRRIITLTAETESLDLPPGSLARLEPGRRYTWQVVALSMSNEEIMRADPQPFVLLPGGR